STPVQDALTLVSIVPHKQSPTFQKGGRNARGANVYEGQAHVAYLRRLSRGDRWEHSFHEEESLRPGEVGIGGTFKL
ncbi:MAG TPA: hypothetical protein P5534_15925, partial [Candidatus Paceibacterota bacterium]|nr:hypothetical protein [Candidatus Paceibacterota bacterium]